MLQTLLLLFQDVAENTTLINTSVLSSHAPEMSESQATTPVTGGGSAQQEMTTPTVSSHITYQIIVCIPITQKILKIIPSNNLVIIIIYSLSD